mmetsp:Transcript_23414/g.46615  ORF Transcript_23414/g.46615 Transcript_23414/m.46615 type:complete len:132 (-) Transcript_23414:746-1141(-)
MTLAEASKHRYRIGTSMNRAFEKTSWRKRSVLCGVKELFNLLEVSSTSGKKRKLHKMIISLPAMLSLSETSSRLSSSVRLRLMMSPSNTMMLKTGYGSAMYTSSRSVHRLGALAKRRKKPRSTGTSRRVTR